MKTFKGKQWDKVKTNEFRCRQCGSNETVPDDGVGGGGACVGCGCGISSPAYGKAEPFANCSRCGSPIYTAELFRGPVCPRCGHWC